MAPIIDSVLRAGEGRLLRKLKRISEQINSIEDDFVAMSDADLRDLTGEFRQRYADGELEVTTLYELREGKVVRVHQYDTTKEALEAAGPSE